LSKEERIRKLTLLLKELFQFDNNDLDFGIYRIINIKRKEISEFIDKELFEIIKEKIKTVEDNTELQKNLESLKKEIENTFGCDIIEAKKKYAETPKVKDYVEKEKEFKVSEKESDIEEEIYDNIISFFSRYYDKGDFISKRRYSKDNKYAIPYNGEEVYLYWANNDQYYIKTAENFRNYSFKAGSLKVDFEITSEEVDVEKNNIKDTEKKFFIFYDADYDQSNKIVNVKFGYRGLTEDEENTIMELTDKKRLGKDEVNVYNLEKINEKIAIYGLSELQQKHTKMDGSKSDSSELKWHLNKYTTKNTSDYFIHKNLKKFLKQELDFYIKNELLHIDDIDTKENLDINLKRIKVFKEISMKIIEFLAQIEDFQKKLWEKKKFVISTDYCITLDYIDERYYPEILKNEKQLEEWKNLYSLDIDEQVKKLQETLTHHGKNDEEKKIEVLKQNSSLSLDTKFYDIDFKYRLICEIDNLDDKITGLLVNSDNFQALNLFVNKYEDKIKCCYIDPPYNAKSSEIIYKNTFKHSSWLSLMENRSKIAKELLRKKDGIFIVAIDENEQERLGLLLDRIFTDYDKTCLSIIHNPGGIQGKNFSYTHEFAYFIFPQGKELIGKRKIEDANTVPLRDWGGNESTRESARNCFYPIKIKDGKIIEFGEICDDDYHPESSNLNQEDGSVMVFPIDQNGVERKWRNARNTVEDIKDELFADKIRGEWAIKRKKSIYRFKTVWLDKEYNSNVYGSKILGQIIDNNIFSFPKSIFTTKDSVYASTHDTLDAVVIDFFAGSGTTGHAVLKLNKEDNGKRKFILIEMGNYFDTVLKPRILKVIYSDNWKNGKPQDDDGSKKQIIKYQTLEQYEDSLNNIDFKEPSTLAKESKDYKLKYMLEFESKGSNVLLNLDMFDNPFEYKIKVEENNEIIEKNVDLIETFNYIYGIDVKSIQKKKNLTTCYIIVKGQRKEKDIIVIWRDKSDDFNPEEDKKFIETEVLTEDFDEIFTNGTSLVKEAKSVDEIFKTKLFRG
jgi:adenine-specific DNA-methyltransferase